MPGSFRNDMQFGVLRHFLSISRCCASGDQTSSDAGHEEGWGTQCEAGRQKHQDGRSMRGSGARAQSGPIESAISVRSLISGRHRHAGLAAIIGGSQLAIIAGKVRVPLINLGLALLHARPGFRGWCPVLARTRRVTRSGACRATLHRHASTHRMAHDHDAVPRGRLGKDFARPSPQSCSSFVTSASVKIERPAKPPQAAATRVSSESRSRYQQRTSTASCHLLLQ